MPAEHPASQGPPPATIDLNADLGESEPFEASSEEALLDLVSSAHIACGFHAGGPETMRRTVAAALERGVRIGAHPSYPDRAGFGRRELGRPAALVADDVVYQVAALQGIAVAHGAGVESVKPHGALYHRASADAACARAVARATAAVVPGARLVLAAGSSGIDAARAEGLAVVGEGFADRRYLPDGTLVPRSEPGAVIVDPEAAARAALRLVERGSVETDGGEVPLGVGTICVHGDTPGAVAVAAAVRAALLEAGIAIEAPPTTP
jgi:UPF0271 protein